MNDVLYDTDIVVWSENQAALLRRVARGERVNGVDWEHVAEEIADVGNSELRAVESLWLQTMLHAIKLTLMPDDTAARHWGHEITAFLAQAENRFVPSMRQRIDLEKLWRRCVTLSAQDFDGIEGFDRLPAGCPWTVDQLLDGDRGALLDALGGSSRAR